MNPKISIITPCFNCEKFISETIESVLKQTYTNFEMIIVDDASTDKSFDIIKEYALKDSRIKYFQNQQNSGAYYSRNFAIKNATGDYIAFLDSDDIWDESKIKTQIEFMENNNCDFSYTSYELIDEMSNSLYKFARVKKNLTYIDNLFHNWPGCLTVMYNQNTIGKVYGQKKGNGDDYDLFLKILKKSKKAMGLKISLAKYRKHSNSISYNRFKMIKNHIETLHKFNNIPLILAIFFLLTHSFYLLTLKYKKNRK